MYEDNNKCIWNMYGNLAEGLSKVYLFLMYVKNEVSVVVEM
jgi:hypothetical protein